MGRGGGLEEIARPDITRPDNAHVKLSYRIVSYRIAHQTARGTSRDLHGNAAPDQTEVLEVRALLNRGAPSRVVLDGARTRRYATPSNIRRCVSVTHFIRRRTTSFVRRLGTTERAMYYRQCRAQPVLTTFSAEALRTAIEGSFLPRGC